MSRAAAILASGSQFRLRDRNQVPAAMLANFNCRLVTTIPVANDHIQLWLADLDECTSTNMLDSLSDQEKLRAQRFVFANDKRRYQCAHHVIRTLLSQRIAAEPHAIDFDYSTAGKPRLASSNSSSAPCRFNLSHSDDLALIGISGAVELGVDIEMLRDLDYMALQADILSPLEHDQLSLYPKNMRTSIFLRIWTRKEACLKAIGCGLAVLPNTFHVGVKDHSLPVIITLEDHRHSIQVRSVDVGKHAIAAVAWQIDKLD